MKNLCQPTTFRDRQKKGEKEREGFLRWGKNGTGKREKELKRSEGKVTGGGEHGTLK